MLDVAAKRRLTGAVVLVVLAVVFLPMMMEEDALEEPVPEDELAMPEPPPRAGGGQAEIFQNFDAPGGRAGPGLAADDAPEPDSDAELETLPNLGDEVPAPEPAEVATPVLVPDTAVAAASVETTTREPAPEAPKSAPVAARVKPKPVPKAWAPGSCRWLPWGPRRRRRVWRASCVLKVCLPLWSGSTAPNAPSGGSVWVPRWSAGGPMPSRRKSSAAWASMPMCRNTVAVDHHPVRPRTSERRRWSMLKETL